MIYDDAHFSNAMATKDVCVADKPSLVPQAKNEQILEYQNPFE